MIYSHAVHFDAKDDVKPVFLGLKGPGLVPSLKLQLLLAYRQIYHEAHDSAFQATNFYFGSSLLQVVELNNLVPRTVDSRAL